MWSCFIDQLQLKQLKKIRIGNPSISADCAGFRRDVS